MPNMIVVLTHDELRTLRELVSRENEKRQIRLLQVTESAKQIADCLTSLMNGRVTVASYRTGE